MATLVVPALVKREDKIWATLGEDVATWLEANAVWGPGSKFGQPVTIDDEFFAWLLRAYQIFPHDHPRAGRRRFDLCSLEQVKGTGKTEKALAVGQAEFHPSGPVRCVDWRKQGRAWVPIGAGPPFPRLVFLAHSEEQVQRTAFGRFRQALERSPLAGSYHITMDKIVLLGEDGSAGEAYPLPASPDSADGDLPTWQHVDEPHRWTAPRHHKLMATIAENATKDVDADAWMLTTSTAGAFGARSVEQSLLETAELIDKGKADQPGFFFFRRWAPDEMPLTTEVEVEAAVLTARGPAAEWSGDIPRIVNRFFAPKTDKEYWRRVQLGHWVSGGDRAFDAVVWASRKHPTMTVIPKGEVVTLGFDGARRRDSTAIVATLVRSGFQQLVKVWERPHNAPDDWEVDAEDVDLVMEAAFTRWNVWRLYADPPYWEEPINGWAGRHGTTRNGQSGKVVRWYTNEPKKMAYALRNYRQAIATTVTHNGHRIFAEHIANAFKRPIHVRTESEFVGDDDEDQPLWVIEKERHDSPNKIDIAMAACLSWEARGHAIAAGALQEAKKKGSAKVWTRS